MRLARLFSTGFLPPTSEGLFELEGIAEAVDEALEHCREGIVQADDLGKEIEAELGAAKE